MTDLATWWRTEAGPTELDELDRVMLDTQGDRGRVSAMTLSALHRVGCRSLLSLASGPVFDVNQLSNQAKQAVECIRQVSKSDDYWRDLLVRDLQNDAITSAERSYTYLTSQGVAPSTAVERIALVFGVPYQSLGSYLSLAKLPNSPKPKLQDMADKVVLDRIRRVEEAEPTEAVSKEYEELEHPRDAETGQWIDKPDEKEAVKQPEKKLESREKLKPRGLKPKTHEELRAERYARHAQHQKHFQAQQEMSRLKPRAAEAPADMEILKPRGTGADEEAEAGLGPPEPTKEPVLANQELPGHVIAQLSDPTFILNPPASLTMPELKRATEIQSVPDVPAKQVYDHSANYDDKTENATLAEKMFFSQVPPGPIQPLDSMSFENWVAGLGDDEEYDWDADRVFKKDTSETATDDQGRLLDKVSQHWFSWMAEDLSRERGTDVVAAKIPTQNPDRVMNQPKRNREFAFFDMGDMPRTMTVVSVAQPRGAGFRSKEKNIPWELDTKFHEGVETLALLDPWRSKESEQEKAWADLSQTAVYWTNPNLTKWTAYPTSGLGHGSYGYVLVKEMTYQYHSGPHDPSGTHFDPSNPPPSLKSARYEEAEHPRDEESGRFVEKPDEAEPSGLKPTEVLKPRTQKLAHNPMKESAAARQARYARHQQALQAQGQLKPRTAPEVKLQPRVKKPPPKTEPPKEHPGYQRAVANLAKVRQRLADFGLDGHIDLYNAAVTKGVIDLGDSEFSMSVLGLGDPWSDVVNWEKKIERHGISAREMRNRSRAGDLATPMDVFDKALAESRRHRVQDEGTRTIQVSPLPMTRDLLDDALQNANRVGINPKHTEELRRWQAKAENAPGQNVHTQLLEWLAKGTTFVPQDRPGLITGNRYAVGPATVPVVLLVAPPDTQDHDHLELSTVIVTDSWSLLTREERESVLEGDTAIGNVRVHIIYLSRARSGR